MSDQPRTPTDSSELDLDAETAELIASTHARLEQTDLFTLFDVDLNASRAVLQRGYFTRSRLFHPDRYFNRRLGPYKKMLERIFAWMSAAYDFLKDDRRRAAYRKRVLEARGDRRAVFGDQVVAVETANGLEFVIADEATFFAASAAEDPGAPQPGARPVALPKKQYALPRLKRPER
jgi:DnaJ-class molecular chaperone